MRRWSKKTLDLRRQTTLQERIAETIPYDLPRRNRPVRKSPPTCVTMNPQKLMGRDATPSDSLTVLQRRLASSPEAIYQSLLRRSARLRSTSRRSSRGRCHDEQPAIRPPSDYDERQYSAEEIEVIEEELVDAATAARTVAELDTELLELADLVESARAVRASGEDRKWVELRGLLQDQRSRTTRLGVPENSSSSPNTGHARLPARPNQHADRPTRCCYGDPWGSETPGPSPHH